MPNSIISNGMTNTTTLHIVARDTAERGKMARLAFDSGFHAEIYANELELADAAPQNGLGLVEGGEAGSYVELVLQRLEKAGQYLPLVAFSYAPSVPDVVRIIKCGAIDFITTPSTSTDLQTLVSRVLPEAEALRSKRQVATAAKARISCLSARERQVLDYLVQGYSNKMTARTLEISPRTVEIHRMKMMAKLGVRNSIEALRFRIQAEMLAT